MAGDLFTKEPAAPTLRDRLRRRLINARVERIESAFKRAEAAGDDETRNKKVRQAKTVLDARQRQVRRETARKRAVCLFEDRGDYLEVWVNLNGSASTGALPYEEALKVSDLLAALPDGEGMELTIGQGSVYQVLNFPKDVVPQAKKLFGDWACDYLLAHPEASQALLEDEDAAEAMLHVAALPRRRPSGLAERLAGRDSLDRYPDLSVLD